MPFVRIELLEGRPEGHVRAVSGAVHRALTETLGVPERDRFQVVTEHRQGRLVYDPGYLDVERTDGFVLVQIFLASGRTAGQKRAFYSRLAGLLAEDPGIRKDDLMVQLVETELEDWSFGNGEAQMLTLPRERWR